jgi:hypothetical protein
MGPDVRSRSILLALLFCAATASGEATERATPAAVGAREGAASQPDPRELEVELTSPPFRVDQIFRSMVGPQITRKFHAWNSPRPELMWLTGYAVEVVGADGQSAESMDFECHTNLIWARKKPPDWSKRSKPRIFTLTQGQTDIRLPPGFGLPMLSDEGLVFNTQVLNLNEPEIDRTVIHRAQLRYVRDRDLTEPMKPLIATNAQALVSLEGEPLVPNVETPGDHLDGASCHAGEFAGNRGPVPDRLGRRFAPHWVVTPGHHEFHTLVTEKMAIPYDTTVHFIGVHVHPLSESLELRDRTSGETVYKSYQRNRKDRLGLLQLDYFSSEEGIPIYDDHHYELISIYDNPTDRDSDAMGLMVIYYLDKEFEHPLKRGSKQGTPEDVERL